MEKDNSSGPLAGLTILEVGHFVAAPFAARVLADLGADVIKVEPLGGDPVRQWGERVDGNSLWWSVHGRNKRCVTIDLKHPEGRELFIALAARADAILENFRPGQLEKLGIGPAALEAVNPDLIVARISGYGQDGPYRDRPAFGVIGEAMGGLRYLTNMPPGKDERPPVRVGVSIGDSIAGLYSCIGILAALFERSERVRRDFNARGQTVDIALTEAVFSMMEGMLPEFGHSGKIKQPTGGGIATAAPSNAYPTADGGWVLIAGNSDPIFDRLTRLIGDPALADACFSGNPGRVANAARLDAIIGAWTRTKGGDELLALLDASDVPAGKIYTAADCAADEQYRARAMVREIEDANFGTVLHPGVVPHFPGNPGTVRWPGPAIGAHNAEVFRQYCAVDDTEYKLLQSAGVIL